MRAFLAALTLLPLTACALQPIPTDGPGRGYRPLRAQVAPGAGGLEFYVSRPAHVALFEIAPGQGTSLIYPSPGLGRMDGFVFSGGHNLGSIRRHNSFQYLPASNALAGPRFYFLIASERPLDLQSFGSYGMGLHSSLGMHFASLNPYSAMERLATLALPSTMDDGSWTTDLYVHWPQVLYDSPRRRSGLVQVNCNGYSMFVPLEYLVAVRETVCAPREGTTPQPADSTSRGEPGVVEPKRRAPLPKAQAEDLRERITSSTQLEEPESRRVTPRSRWTDTGDRAVPGRTAEPRVRSRPGTSDEPRWNDRDRGSPSPPRDVDRATPRSDRGARAEPRARPVAEPSDRPAAREPSSSPPPRGGGDTPRAAPREPPPCNPCQR